MDASSLITKNHNDIYPALEALQVPTTLPGAVVMITGGSQGIGKAAGIAYAKAGAKKVIITGRTLKTLEQAAEEIRAANSKTEVVIFTCDVTQADQVSKTVAEAWGTEGIDILNNNAGVLEKILPIAESDPDTWWGTYDSNLRGTYLFTRAFLQHHEKEATQKRRVIILTTSIGAVLVMPGFSAYMPSKTAVARFAEFVNAEYADKGILAISYHPGGVATTLSENMPAHTRHVLEDTPEMGGGFCVWLATKSADFLAGRYASANWDIEELETKAKLIVEKDLLKLRLTMP